MNGKGSQQRPLSIHRQAFERRWREIFGGATASPVTAGMGPEPPALGSRPEEIDDMSTDMADTVATSPTQIEYQAIGPKSPWQLFDPGHPVGALEVALDNTDTDGELVRAFGIPEEFYAIRLPDNRVWDCMNGWMQAAPSPASLSVPAGTVDTEELAQGMAEPGQIEEMGCRIHYKPLESSDLWVEKTTLCSAADIPGLLIEFIANRVDKSLPTLFGIGEGFFAIMLPDASKWDVNRGWYDMANADVDVPPPLEPGSPAEQAAIQDEIEKRMEAAKKAAEPRILTVPPGHKVYRLLKKSVRTQEAGAAGLMKISEKVRKAQADAMEIITGEFLEETRNCGINVAIVKDESGHGKDVIQIVAYPPPGTAEAAALAGAGFETDVSSKDDGAPVETSKMEEGTIDGPVDADTGEPMELTDAPTGDEPVIEESSDE